MSRKRMLVSAWAAGGLLASGLAFPAEADFVSGKAAFERHEYVRAYRELLDEAQAGNAEAEYMIGELTADGLGVARSYQLAAKWYAMSAAKGYVPANLTLGILYLYGAGTETEASAVAADPARAAAYLKVAADAGDREAGYLIGQLYMTGDGVSKDTDRAYAYSVEAAKRGVIGAQYNAAVLALRGGDTPANLMEAYKWFALAARQGYPGAEQNRKHIATYLNPIDLNKAEAEVDSFRAVQ